MDTFDTKHEIHMLREQLAEISENQKLLQKKLDLEGRKVEILVEKSMKLLEITQQVVETLRLKDTL